MKGNSLGVVVQGLVESNKNRLAEAAVDNARALVGSVEGGVWLKEKKS